MTALGSEFAMLLLVSGNWHTLAKIETELDKLAERDSLSVSVRRTASREPRSNLIPYLIDVVCLQQPDVVEGIAGFFASRDIDIAELSTHSYSAAHTGSPMLSVQLTVSIPAELSISALRDEFLEFCDSRNFDAVIEPIKTDSVLTARRTSALASKKPAVGKKAPDFTLPATGDKHCAPRGAARQPRRALFLSARQHARLHE